MMEMEVKIKKLDEGAKLPVRGSNGSAGYDLFACINENIKVQPHETVKIQTGLATEMPSDIVALIYSRSGTTVKKGLVVAQGTGVIDNDYRGEWFIPIHNDTNIPQIIEPGERVAQVIFMNFIQTKFVETKKIMETKRGTGGFGSTGVY